MGGSVRGPVLSLVVAVFIGCTPHIACAESLTVGVVAPLTGKLSDFGAAVQNAFILAQAHHPDAFSHLRIVLEDNQSQTSGAVSAVNKLLTLDKPALVYVWGTTATEAVVPVAEDKQVPIMTTSINPHIARGRKYVIRTVSSSRVLAQALFSYLIEQGITEAAVIVAEYVYYEELYNALSELAAGRLRTTRISVSPDERDFRTVLARHTADKHRAIGIFAAPGQLSSFFRQKHDLKNTLPVFSTDSLDSEKEIRESGPAAEGTVFAHAASCEAMRLPYVERFGNDNQLVYATIAYDAAVLLADTAAQREIRDAQAFYRALRRPGVRKGVCFEFEVKETVAEGLFFSYPVALRRVTGGKAVQLDNSVPR